MGFFNFFNQKDIEERSFYSSNGQNLAIISLLGGSHITEEQAMKIPSVVACMNLIEGTISQLPIYLYQENGQDVVKVPDKRNRLLNVEANYFTNSQSFKRKIVKDYLFYGKAIIYVERKGNTIVSLNALNAKDVQFKQYTGDGITLSNIEVTYNGLATSVQLNYEDLIIIDSGNEGILKYGVDTLELALEQNTYSSNLLKNGALPIGVIQTMNRLSDTAIKRLRAGWESLYGGSKNSGKTVILEEGVEYKPIALNPEQLQLTNSRKATNADICKLFGVDESLINAEFNKYSANSQQNLAYLQYTLAPIIAAIESAFDKSMLLESEKDNGYYFRFDTSEILRGTPKEQIESVGIAVEKGLLSVNEGRAVLDRNAINKDYFMWSLGHVLYDAKKDEMIVPNMMGTIEDGKAKEGDN
ncbi:phage portal protein [Fictibacillus sp. KU28468]|uniref:phage portal protein n=1 Tax=Fictibacillus sp. KU28468 TaxID=2991053 RepID=UPI00223E8862|nr:phage portal protein [Fictibacillus sp. KU28468]UZJ79437.1 phage portal protein [Fictibacillus sp. KU28468]